MTKHYKRKLVNRETGEWKYDNPKWQPYFDPEDYIQKEFIDGKIERKEFEDKFFNFIAEFQSNLRENYGANFAEIGKLLLLMTYTTYRNKELGRHYILTDNNKDMTNKRLSTIWKLTLTQARNVKSIMKKKGLIGEDDEGLYITDDIMIRGKIYPKEKKDLNYYVMFDSPIRDLYNQLTDEGVRDSSICMGVFLSLVPFIRVSTSKKKQGKVGSNNRLVVSEWDNDRKEYVAINKVTLAKRLNIGRTSLDRYLGKLNRKSKEITGKYLLYDIKPSGYNGLDKTIMVINPYYTYTQGTGSESFKLLESWIEEAEKAEEADRDKLEE